MATERASKVRAEAQRLLTESNITRPDQIDLEKLAAAQGAEIVYEDLEGATASVLRLGERARIRISTRIHDTGWCRFSIAHELGHMRLGHEIPNGDAADAVEMLCKPFDKTRSAPERDASVFASEIVMPEPMVRPRCAVSHVTLAPARAIAEEFTTSVLASAMRFVELTDEACAVAYSSLGRVRWLKPSSSFPNWIPRGKRLDPRSAAFEYHDSGLIETSPQLMTADVWLPREHLDTASVQMVEHSAVIAPLGVVFSMLWIPRRELAHIDLAS